MSKHKIAIRYSKYFNYFKYLYHHLKGEISEDIKIFDILNPDYQPCEDNLMYHKFHANTIHNDIFNTVSLLNQIKKLIDQDLDVTDCLAKFTALDLAMSKLYERLLRQKRIEPDYTLRKYIDDPNIKQNIDKFLQQHTLL